MNDSVRVQVLQCIDDLHSVTLHLKFVQPLPSLEQVVHALVGAQFEQDVHVFLVLKEVLELYHVDVLDGSMNFDLAHKLLLGPALGQR